MKVLSAMVLQTEHAHVWFLLCHSPPCLHPKHLQCFDSPTCTSPVQCTLQCISVFFVRSTGEPVPATIIMVAVIENMQNGQKGQQLPCLEAIWVYTFVITPFWTTQKSYKNVIRPTPYNLQIKVIRGLR